MSTLANKKHEDTDQAFGNLHIKCAVISSSVSKKVLKILPWKMLCISYWMKYHFQKIFNISSSANTHPSEDTAPSTRNRGPAPLTQLLPRAALSSIRHSSDHLSHAAFILNSYQHHPQLFLAYNAPSKVQTKERWIVFIQNAPICAFGSWR